jgi:peptidoglycan hydrolase-like amidase
VIGGVVLGASNASLVETRVEPGDQGTIRLNVTPNVDATRVLQLRVLQNGRAVFNDMFRLKLVIGDGGIQTVQTPNTPSQNNNSDVTLQSEDVLGPNIRINISTFQLNQADVSSDSNASLLVDGRAVGSLNANQRITIDRSGVQVRTTLNGSSFSGNSIVIKPNNINAINTVHNYENRPAWNTSLNDNEFRGTLEFRVIDNGLRVINELPIEHYMRGVAEISNNAETEKIKTIMVAARSYAYFHIVEAPDRKFPGKGYNLDDSPDRTQKYLGYGFEKRSPNVVRAIQDTAGKVITYNGNLIIVPYFNNSDGRTRSAQEVWGWTNTPYLQSVEDKYCPTPNQLLGHGVGISGCGSTGMARAGYSHEDIIKYYLQGTDFRIAYSSTGGGEAAGFPDVEATNPFRDAIRFVRARGIVEGYPDGTFKPNNRINRAEFTKIVIEAKFDSIPEQSSCFSDVPNGEWFTKYVCLAKQEGIIDGYPDGTFKPAQEINIAEALKITLETFYTNIPNVQGEWFMKYRRYAENNNLFLTDRWTAMATRLTRGEMAELIYRILR